jgi:outer membrane protein assembly factor BamB
MRRFLFAVAVLAALLADAVRADDWPEFRGPGGQGAAPNARAPVSWSQTKNVAWKQPLPGTGWSSPVVCQGRVYLTTAVPVTDNSSKDQALEALCLDARTGKILWEKEVFREEGATAPRIHTKNSHASPTPLVHGQRLYVHFGHQGTACLDLDGKILWQNTSLKYEPVHGNGGSPILVDDALYFSCDGGDQRFVVALAADTGKIRWKKERTFDTDRSFSFSTPLCITVDGKKQIITPGSGGVNAYNARTGEEIWRVRYDGYSVIPQPVYGQGLVILSSGFNSPALLAIRPDGKGDVTDSHVAWQTRKGAPHTPSPLLVGDELYVVSDSGTASCLDARTGRVHWQKRLGGNYSASPILAGDKVYFQSEEGTGVVVQPGREYKEVGRNSLQERTLASYAVADGALFIRTAKHLYRIQDE